MFGPKISLHNLFFLLLTSVIVGGKGAAATEWVSCFLVDEFGYEDTIFPLMGGVLSFHYQYPNVAPLDLVYSIDGIPQRTYSTMLPQFFVAPSEPIQEAMDITEEHQGALGVGIHFLTVNITHDNTVYSCVRNFTLVEPVTGVHLVVYKRYISTNEKFKALTYISSGFPCIIEWLVLDASDSIVFVKETEVDGKTSGRSFMEMLSSTVPGLNTVYVTVYNELSYEVADYRVIIEHPVRQVSLTSNSPVRYPDSTIYFIMTLDDVPLPSSVIYDIDFGDGLVFFSDPDMTLADGVSVVQFNHRYTSPGLYKAMVMVHNKVSHEVAIATIGILEDIKNVSLLAYTRQNNYARPLQILPMEWAVKFLANYDTGTVEYTTWDIESTSINTPSAKHWHRFSVVGWYNITATVGNTYSSESASISIKVLESVTSLYLVNDGPVHLGDNITYVLFCKQQGSSPSYKIDLGDGTAELNLTIPEKNPNVTDYLPSNLKIPFNPKEYFSTVFSYFYNQEGRYVATATGWNPVSHLTSTYEAFIQVKPCMIPDINIRDGGSNYDSATKYKRSKSFLFAAKVDLDCQGAKKADYLWRIYTIDDIFSVPSIDNEFHVPQHVNAKVTDLYIPKYLLDYGRYIFEINVVMIMRDGTIGVSSRDQSYIEVVQSPLVAKISGGSAIDIGWTSNITLDGSESFDPDWEDGYDGEYHWYCHLNNETLPSDIDVYQELPTTGGCLGSGMHLQSGNDSILFIGAENLRGNQSYVFHLGVNKPGREHVGWAMQTVMVMPGTPPELAIQCLHNCNSYMNPSERFALVGMCTDCSHNTRNKYTWTVSRDSALPDHMVGWRRVIHGRRKAFLSFPVDTFLGMATYYIKLRIDSWSGASSRAEYTFTTNSPPSQGNCSISPSEGTVMETKFHIACHGFADPQGPLLYEARAFTGSATDDSGSTEAGKGSVVYYGVDPIFPPTLLPVGQASNDFNITIKIRVSDSLGANVQATTFVKVKGPAVENQTEPVEDTVLRLAQGGDSELSQLIASGSMQSATQLVTSITSVLNAQTDNTLGDNDMQNEKQEKRKKARESLIDTLSQVEVRDMESLEQTSAAVAQVTQQQQEVSMDAQVKMTDMYLGMGKFLKDQSDSDVGGQVVESSARFLVSGLSNMMGAAFTEMEHINQMNESMEDSIVNDTEIQDRTLKARNVTMAVLSAMKDVQSAVLHNKVPGEGPTELETESLKVSLQRQENWQLGGLELKSKDDSNEGVVFQLPERMHELIEEDGNMGSDDVIDTQMYHFKNNPYSWAADSNEVTSQVVGLQFTRADQSEVPIKNLPETIDMYLGNSNASSSPILPSIHPKTNETLYAFNWTNSDASILIQIDCDNKDSDDLRPEIEVCIQFEIPPNATDYVACKLLPEVKFSGNFSGGNVTDVSPYSWLLHPENVTDFGTYYMSIETLENLEDSPEDLHEHVVYAYQTQCIYWDNKEEEWKGDGCKVGPYTSLSHTHCQCNHLTFFALSLFILPNAVHFAKDAFLFLTFLDNPVTVATVCAVFALYWVVAIWARRKDKVEQQKAMVIYLKDNDPRAHYRYHITIFTGMRRNAGTTSLVTITLNGSFGSSIPHVLSAKNQDILQRNSVDSFILTTYKSLGILTSVRVWHDNNGTSPEWYVSRILVHDLEQDRWWYFLCRSWLAVDLGGRKIDKTFEAATHEDLNEFHNMVLSKSVRDIKDNHVWFSVVLKPPQSYFTRLQRATCCLQLLLTSMMMNIIFYDVPDNPNLQNLNFGGIQISLSTILVGIQASLMSVPIGLIIDSIFRNSRPRYVTVPDPLQVHSSMSMGMIAGSMRNQFRRLTHQFSQTFHFGRSESNQLLDQSVKTPPLVSPSTSVENQQKEFGWFRREPRSNSQSFAEIPSTSSSKTLDGKLMDEESPHVQTQSTEYHEGHVSVVRNADGATFHRVSAPSVVIEIPPDFSHDTSSSVRHRKICEQDDVDWYRLELCTPEPFDAVYDTKPMDVDDDDNSDNFFSASQSTVHSDQTNLSADGPKVKSTIYEDYLVDKINECRQNLCNKPSEEFTSKHGKLKAVRKLDLIMKLQGWEGESVKDEEEEELEEDLIAVGILPWWFIYIAWILTTVNCLVCAYYIILYGLRYGWQTSLDWLVSMLVSIIQSVLIIQPVKVVVLAAIFAIALKTHQLDDVGAQFFRNWKPPKITPSSEEAEESVESIQRYKYVRAINTILYNPPPSSSVVKAQEKRRVAAKVHALFRSFIYQVVFVFFVLEIAYTQQNSVSFYLGKSMRDKYESVSEVLALSDLFDWMEEFIPETYMDDPGHLPDSNRLIGSIRVRQIRVKPGICTVAPEFKSTFSACKSPLKAKTIDKGSYGPSWAYKSTDKHSNDPWDYQSSDVTPGSYYHVASMGYDTGGFIADLGSNSKKASKVMSNLKVKNWIDDNSWAVFVEWTIYNANVNLFSVNTVLFEVDMVGALRGSSEFQIVRLHRYTSEYDIFVRVLEAVYFLVVIMMIFRDYTKWKKLGSDYFNFWNCLNLIIIVVSICTISFYILRHGLGLIAMKLHKGDRNRFVSFSRVAFINQLVVQFISLIVFCGTLKCAKVLRYNTSIFMLQQAVKNVSKQFASFTFGIVIALVCFATYSCLEFGRVLFDFKTVLGSLETLFIAITGGLDNLESVAEEFPIRAFFFFIALAFFGIFILFQFYISFIMAAFEEARHCPQDYEDHDVIANLVHWLLARFAVDHAHEDD